VSDSLKRKAAKGALFAKLGRFPTSAEVTTYLRSHRDPSADGGPHGGPTGAPPSEDTGAPTGAPSRTEIPEITARLPAERMEGPVRVRAPSNERSEHTRRTGIGFMRWSEPCRCEIGRDH
jgi:hypothetical protein